jgi:HAD superfamily hydrolase (TIGR01509 family)
VIPRAIVFDFDGVIANSEPLHLLAFQDVIAQAGASLTRADYYTRYLGFDDAGVFAAVAADQHAVWGPDFIVDLVARKARRLEELERSTSLLFPGAREAIARLAALLPLAIASGARREEIERVLAHESLAGYFLAVVGAEDTPASKPAPDPYRLAVRRLIEATGTAVDPHECVAIEDSRWGLESARAAGLRTIAITNTSGAHELDADRVVQHLDALTWDFLREIE